MPYFVKDTFFVDFSKDLQVERGLYSFLKFKLSILITTLLELFGLLAVIKTISSLFQKSLMDIYKNSRGHQCLVFNLTSFQKLYIFSLMLVLPNFISTEHRLPLLSVTFLAYQACYL